ncbi:MAG: SpoIIE family protein phosphatase [Bacteroidetes bacterium]|nr:SpoIIE family protein phosphatase [Bacteroidota bacterium]
MDLTRDKIQVLQIENESDIGECRRKGVVFAKQNGFNDIATGEVAIMITEMGTNVLKHGGGKGKLMMCRIRDTSFNTGLEFWCCDFGKGFTDIDLAIQDGYTNSNSLGIGLGSIQRLSDEFEINPEKNIDFNQVKLAGTSEFKNCIRTRKWLQKSKWNGLNRNLLIGASSRAKPGEQLNGDTYVITHLSGTVAVASVIDGLGHGKEANRASQMAKELIVSKPDMAVDALINQVHNTIKGTRGATVGIIRIDTGNNRLFFSGIGNIEGQIYSNAKKTNLLSYGGIVGHNIRTPRVFELDFNKGDTVCLYSDGIISRWQYEEIDWEQSPQENAEYIVNQYSRISDDATVLIIRYVT